MGKPSGENSVAASDNIKSSASTVSGDVSAKEIYARMATLNSHIDAKQGRSAYSELFRTAEARENISKYLPEGSLARQIVESGKPLTDKQRWVVAYELQKSEKYTSQLKADKQAAIKAEQSKRESAAYKKERKKAVAQKVAAAGKVEAKVGAKVTDKFGFTGKIVAMDNSGFVTVEYEATKTTKKRTTKVPRRLLNI